MSNKDIVDALENQLFNVSGNDPKTRQYRDMTKALQLKLRGTRYIEARNNIRSGEVKIEDVCTDEYINSKAAPPTRPTAAAPQSARGPAIAGGRGVGGITPRPGSSLGMGPAGRGRGVPPLGIGRGRGMPPMGRGGLPLTARAPTPIGGLHQRESTEQEEEKVE